MLDTSQRSKSTTEAKSFSDLYTFIPLRKSHLKFLEFVFNDEQAPFEQCYGRTLVDKQTFMPLGMCLIWFRPEGMVTVHAHYGEYLRKWPKDILRGMKFTMDEIRAAGIRYVFAIAHDDTPGSHTLIKFFKGEPTGQHVPGCGDYYVIDLEKAPI